MLELEKITKVYGNLTAVSQLNLAIKDGEFFGFLGPNGAGKTTTVRMIAGLSKPTSGRILVEGFDAVKNPKEAKLKIGLIPDRPYLYTRLRGREFLRFVGELYGVGGKEADGEIERLLELFGLNAWGDELIESYSLGMRQRLVFASALLHSPKILVVDEPLVGLDPEGANLVKRLMTEHCERGGTVFMSTHSLEIVEAICTRIGIIHHGRLIADGSVDDIKSRIAGVDSKSPALVDAFLALTRDDDRQTRRGGQI